MSLQSVMSLQYDLGVVGAEGRKEAEKLKEWARLFSKNKSQPNV